MIITASIVSHYCLTLEMGGQKSADKDVRGMRIENYLKKTERKKEKEIFG